MTGSLASVHPELIPEWSERNFVNATLILDHSDTEKVYH